MKKTYKTKGFRLLSRILPVFFLLSAFATSGWGQEKLIDFPFTGDSPSPTDVADGLTASDFAVSSGSLSFGSFQASTWTGSGVPYAQGSGGWNAENVNDGKYFSFTLETDGATDFSLTELSFLYRSTGAGPESITIRINGDDLETITSANSNSTESFSLVLNITEITEAQVRIIGWNGGTGDFRIDDVQLRGSVTIGVNPPSISNIIQTPATDITSATTVAVSADVTEGDAAIDKVELHWNTDNDFDTFSTIIMAFNAGDTYATVDNIGAQADGTTVYYRIYAEDADEESSTSDVQSYTVRDAATTTLPYEEDFSSGEFGDIYTYTVAGSNPWEIASGGAQANGFNGEPTEEHWMVLPGIDFNAYSDEVMTFTTYARFGTIDENNYLKLFYSPDYAGIGEPAAATWTELVFDQPEPGEVGSTEIETASGAIDLSGLAGGNVYLAFKYYSTDSPTSWRVDDISIEEVLLPITFYVDMTNEVGDFTNVDIAGDFNDWGSPVTNLTLVDDNIYTYTTDAVFSPGTEIQFKFRKDGNWETAEPDPNRSYTVVLGDNVYHAVYGVQVPAEITYANLQWPASGTINAGDDYDVYARVFANQLTGDGNVPNLQAWIGYNTENTDPATWESENWFEAAYSAGDHINNDEYMFNLGSELATTGTYYYASRFKLGLADFVYGGFDGGFWDGTTNVSGVLNILADEPDAQATDFDAAEDSESAITLTWTDADPAADGYLVKASATSYAAIEDPVDGEVEADGNLVKNVAAGVETVPFTDLLASTQYYFKIFAYNGSGGTINYKTDDVPEATATTEEAPLPPGLPYAQDFSTFIFDIDTEVTSFGGEDYKEWAFDATGSSADKVRYKGNWGTGTAGGFRGNASVLGYQHTGTTGVFSAELTLLNNSGETIQDLLISYDGMVERADQGRSPEWTVEINGVETPALAYSTVNGVDKKVTALIQNLNIANNTTFTISWSSDRDVDGSGASKQIGIGDVRVSVPPLYTLVGAADEASNYDGDWNDESNEGYGFGDWNLSASTDGGFAGWFIGDPDNAGIDMDAPAFGLFANPAGANFVNADRPFVAPLPVGGTFSLDYGINWDSEGGGNKGINLYSGGTGGTQIININNGGSAAITINGDPMFDNYGTAAMTLHFEYVAEGQLRVYGTGRDGSESYDATLTVAGAPDAVHFYASGMGGGDNRQPYFNNLRIETDPSGIPNDATVLVKGQVDLVDNLETENLIIEEGHLLRIAQDTELDVTGSILNHEGISGLIIADGGSLIHNNNDVPATMEREISFGGWHMIAAPVSGMTILGSDFVPDEATLPTNFDFYAWVEETTTWQNIRSDSDNGYAPNEDFDDEFEPGKGYLVAYFEGSFAENPFAFEGTLNNGNVDIPLSFTAGAFEGVNLIGNPYPSGINWTAVDKDALSTNFAYIYNPNNQEYDYVEAGTIAPNQGFFVIAEADGTFTLANSDRVHGGDFVKNNEMQEALVLSLANESHHTQTTIRILEGSDFDRDRRDALKFFSLSSEMPQVYSYTADNVRVAINSIPQIDEEQPITLGVRIPADGDYTIGIGEVSGSFLDGELILEDLADGTFHDLRAEGSYHFSEVQGDHLQRFRLHFTQADLPTDIGEIAEGLLRAWVYNNNLHIITPDDAVADLFDINGRQLQSLRLPQGEHSQDLNLPAGVYLLRISTQHGTQTQRVVIP